MKLTRNQKKINRLQNTMENSIYKLIKMEEKLNRQLERLDSEYQKKAIEQDSIKNLVNQYREEY